MSSPLIELEQNATAPVLRYDIPEPTSYTGFNFVQLNFDGGQDIFVEALMTAAASTEAVDLGGERGELLRRKIGGYLATGFSPTRALSTTAVLSTDLAIGARGGADIPPPPDPPMPPTPPGTGVLDDLVDRVAGGERLVLGENVNGDDNVTTVPVPEEPDPHLYLIEELRLTSFLGDYGAGRVVKTFSLLPGERTRISVRTYRHRESTSSRSSSILDSVTRESADDFQQSLQEEQADQRSYEQSKEYYAEVKGKASWGWGSASATAGAKASTNAARQESVKNIASATEKHTAKASAKRDVEINTSSEVTERSEEETSIEREIENINLSRTLNFVFRQMNQAFITFVHLTDVRVGYFDGRRESRREVSISQLDQLLEEVVVDARRADVKEAIVDQLNGIRDLDGNLVDVLSAVSVGADDEFVTFDRSLSTTFTDSDSGNDYELRGVLLGVERYVMRTDGVIVESILGEGAALDSYAEQLQQLEVDRRAAEVAARQATARRAEVVNDILAAGDPHAAGAAAEILRASCCPEASGGVGPPDADV